MKPIEPMICKPFGIPEGTTNLLIPGMDAHMDWDRLNTFQTLVHTGTLSDRPGN